MYISDYNIGAHNFIAIKKWCKFTEWMFWTSDSRNIIRFKIPYVLLLRWLSQTLFMNNQYSFLFLLCAALDDLTFKIENIFKFWMSKISTEFWCYLLIKITNEIWWFISKKESFDTTVKIVAMWQGGQRFESWNQPLANAMQGCLL